MSNLIKQNESIIQQIIELSDLTIDNQRNTKCK